MRFGIGSPLYRGGPSPCVGIADSGPGCSSASALQSRLEERRLPRPRPRRAYPHHHGGRNRLSGCRVREGNGLDGADTRFAGRRGGVHRRENLALRRCRSDFRYHGSTDGGAAFRGYGQGQPHCPGRDDRTFHSRLSRRRYPDLHGRRDAAGGLPHRDLGDAGPYVHAFGLCLSSSQHASHHPGSSACLPDDVLHSNPSVYPGKGQRIRDLLATESFSRHLCRLGDIAERGPIRAI